MDERNERLVFERIVSCTKQSQYFYISPKLLQALTSMEDDDVTVLLVLNGPGLRMVCDSIMRTTGCWHVSD